MKALLNILSKVRPHFDKGGKFEKYLPVYEVFETFMFVPGHTTKRGTHIRDGIDLKRTMITVVFALVPCFLFGIWNTGHQHYLALGEFIGLGEGMQEKMMVGAMLILPVVLVSYIVGLGIEIAGTVIKGHALNEGFLVSGLLIPLILPAGIPLWMVAVATAFAVIIGKEVFGGTGMNIVNPALTARAFLFFAYPSEMSGAKVWVDTSLEEGQKLVDGYTGETVLAQAMQKGESFVGVGGADLSSMDLFYGFFSGSVGETSTLACLIGAGILLITGIASWRIMLSVVAGGYLMALLFNMWGETPFMEVEPLTQLMIGGFAFGAIFMATDPVTATQTNVGKYIYGFFIGLFAILFRVFNPAYPEGMMLAILFMNVMAPMIDHYVVRANIKRRLKRASA